jgi:hypothetical protein
MKDLSVELDVSRQAIDDLQGKLFDHQIELLKAKKELDELKSKPGFDKQDRNKNASYKANIKNQNK